MSDQDSQAAGVVRRLVQALGRERAHAAIDMALAQFTTTELASLAANWNFWARPKQLPPVTAWSSWGALAARAFGKTFAVSNHINQEVQAGRARQIGICAQKEDRTIDVQVLGSSGLIATSPPWFKAVWEPSSMRVVWPNGAWALALTPEVPGAIRGDNYDLFWACEIQSWPPSTREEAYYNILLSTRIGYARFVWDCTPKKGHPILLKLLARAKEEPDRHLVVRGTIHENAANLADHVIADLEKDIGGTQRGREELGGEMLEDSDAALIKMAWINDRRRVAPDRYARRGLGIDPASSARAGSDRTGIVECGLGSDGQGYVISDLSGKYRVEAWVKVVLDTYVNNRLDVIVAETNKGGDYIVHSIRAAAKERDLSVVLLGKDERSPGHVPGHVHVKEAFARGAKEDRAQPLATAYERGRVSHVIGSSLAELENTMTSWEPSPGAKSPDDLDACVHIMGELLELTWDVADPKTGFQGITQAAAQLAQMTGVAAPARVDRPIGRSIAAMLGGSGRSGGTI